MRREVRFLATQSSGEVSAIFDRPEGARALYVFAHGAGAGMSHPFMESAAAALGARRIATFRYQFPYMEQGRRAPNHQPILLKTVRSAVAAAAALAPDLQLLAGGKSMGGRMTSIAQSKEPVTAVRGLVFYGFPLHASGKPSADRGEHLSHVHVPMLFLQGSRDRLADLTLLEPVLDQLGDRATLEVVQDANHSFHVPKRTGKTDAQVIMELAAAVERWAVERAIVTEA